MDKKFFFVGVLIRSDMLKFGGVYVGAAALTIVGDEIHI